jgi:hypothetical protein
MMNEGLINSMITRDAGSEDHYVTPEYAVVPLLKHLPANSCIWECTDGKGTSGISSLLRYHGHNVIDNVSPGRDFLEDEMPNEIMKKVDFIITNPPFNRKDQFIATCDYYAKQYPHLGWALLLPLTALEGVWRGLIWDKLDTDFGMIFLNRRTEFTGGSVWFNCSWYCYKLLKGKQMWFADIRKV